CPSNPIKRARHGGEFTLHAFRLQQTPFFYSILICALHLGPGCAWTVTIHVDRDLTMFIFSVSDRSREGFSPTGHLLQSKGGKPQRLRPRSWRAGAAAVEFALV